MKVENTDLDGVLLISPTTNFEDFRGQYIETYNKKEYAKNGILIDFIQDDFSFSRKHVLRGIHGDNKTWKLITCLHGAFYFVGKSRIQRPRREFGHRQNTDHHPAAPVRSDPSMVVPGRSLRIFACADCDRRHKAPA